MLVCTGRDNISLDGVGHCFFKVVDLDKLGKKGEPGTCVRSTRLDVPPSSSTISTCLAVQENLNIAAVGFSNHCLIILRGDITRDRGTKQKMLLRPSNSPSSSRTYAPPCTPDSHSSSISGLSFKSSGRTSWLYVATTNQILVFNLTGNNKESATQLDNIGCPIGMYIAFLV